ncbi:MAG: DUF4149 domain-containing protein [Thermotogae bacterium]|nr:DUF4149 domain-containing protein [Thermotogota bacterium]
MAFFLMGAWTGILLFHVFVVVPIASQTLTRDSLGKFALNVQDRFHIWGMVLCTLSTVLFLISQEFAAFTLSLVVLVSLLIAEILRRRIRRLLLLIKDKPQNPQLKRRLFDLYRLVAYTTYTQGVAGLGVAIIGLLRL